MDKKMYDLTAPQKSIWLTEQYYTNSNVNNICGTAIVSEILDLNLLKKAISNIIEKNDIFRLHFIENNGNLKQYFEKTESKPIEIIELDSKDDISTLEQKLLTKVFNIYEDLYEFKIFRVEKSNISGFMLNVHHIKADAITLGLCSKKIMQEYIALSNNENIETNEKSTYENYINSEIEYQNSKKYESDKLYWEEKFKEIPNIVTIPSNKKDSTEFSYKANRYNYLVDKEKMNKIIEFCANSKISVFNLFMGILSIYMYRVNNINDFVIGTPILNRTNFVEKNTLGMFINVAPLRVNVNDNSTILEFLSNIATDSMGLLRHQKYSYQSILENIRKTNPSIPNLYNIVLSYQITKANLESDIDYETRWAFNGTCLNDIDIHLFDLDNTGELNIAYDYNVDKYDEQDIVDLNTRLNYLIDQVLENSSVKIQDLEIATPEERDLILNVFNNTKVDYPSDKNIVELFEEQVKLHPDNIAVVFEDEKLTYRELNEKANLLAKYLIEKGLKSNDVIGILFDKSIEMIISILATLKASATYLPLDIQFPKERIEYIIQDSNLKFILSQNKFHITINSNKFIDFNLKNYTYNAYNTNNLSLTINENTPAYIMYTSGTTGNPKGAKVLHKNIIRLVKNTNYIQFTNQDIVLQIGTIAFDASTFEIWGALLNGGTLHLLKKEALLNTTLFSNYLNKNNITTILLTTSLFNKYSEINPKMFSKLKNLVTGGEAASAKHMNLVIKENPNLNLVNAYGPTENGVISSYFKVENSNNDFIPIGQPIANSTCYIVSPTGKLLPPGIPGELWVGGDGVGGGYQNRNTLNTEKFIDNPFQSGKIYKTGDMAAWNSNGILKFFGRIDTQVKIRGFRIELEEINNLLLKHKDIINCTTQIFEQDTEKKLVSYIISDNDITPSELRNYLATKLPVYMIPSYFIKIDNIPLTINGKVDRKALPLPTINTNKTILKPRNNIDKLVIKIIAELTQIKQTNIGISDSIFDLGMDSLSVMNFTNEIYEHLTIPITVKDVFENSIISELSDFINNTQRTHLNKTFSTKTQSVSYTSSRAQKRIFYTANMNPNLCVYNICGGIEFYKKLNFDKICSVFKILIQRHESFRTYFEIIDGELYQKILSNLELKIDFKKITVNQIDEYFKKFNTKFNLCEAPLLKIQVLYLNNNHTMLLINMHHIISDGTSMNILLNEFCQLYNNQELSKIKFNYKDFINYEQYYSGSDSYNKSKTFWLNEFSENIPILNLPTNSTRPATFTFNGKKTSKKINQTLTNSIKALANELNITPYMLLLSAYYILLYKYTGQTDIIVGTPTANRTIKEFSKIIGMFVNTLAIRKHINIESSFKEFSKELKEKCLNCFMYQNYPFDELVKELNLKRDLSRNPLFDTMFSYQNNEKKIINFNNAKLKHYLPDTGISKFDLSLEIISEKNEFKIIAEYCINLFEDKFIDNLLTHYINILKTIVKKPNIKLKNICILSNTEKNTIKSFNITDLDIPKRNTLINRFQNIVKKYPNHIAVEFNTKKITYKKLDKLSNFLAQELIQNGITKGNVIGVCLNKSLELIVSIFAILKIGAIYMPMYTNYPQERLEYMIENIKI